MLPESDADNLGRTATRDVALLSGAEALERLELLADLSRVLDTKVDDYEEAARRVLRVCVPAFADLCAVELIGPSGQPHTVAYEVRKGNGLTAPKGWVPLQVHYGHSRPILAFEGHEEHDDIARARRVLGAESLMLAPIKEGGITVGRFTAATGPHRRAYRKSALRIGEEVASRLAGALERTTLHREMQAATNEQARAVRRLRRLATAATKLAGAATTREVLQVACLEARGHPGGRRRHCPVVDAGRVRGRSKFRAHQRRADGEGVRGHRGPACSSGRRLGRLSPAAKSGP